jgi:UDP-3-O-[3-hydroxymyristoyl] glucosamine N-acyltransferase
MPKSMSPISVREIADQFSLEVIGDPERIIEGIATLKEAQPTDLSFLTSRSYMNDLKSTNAGIVLLAPEAAEASPCDSLVCANPRMVIAQLLHWLFPPVKERSLKGIHPSAQVSETATVHPDAYIGPNVVIGEATVVGPRVCLMANVSIGHACELNEGTLIYPNTTVYHGSQLGQHCVVHSGTVIGGDGFGFEPDTNGHWHKIPQVGGVRIGDYVEIGSNCSIDRGAIEDTVIEDGVILDNLIQIAHNVHIGAHTAIAGCTGISGSTTIGRHCLVGGGSCINGHIKIADGVHISGMSMVTRSIRKSGVYSSGIPARENRTWLKNASRFHQLDELARRLKELEGRIPVN